MFPLTFFTCPSGPPVFMSINCTLYNSVSHISYQPNISVKIRKNKRKITETKEVVINKYGWGWRGGNSLFL
jgi:hypothetical protein